MFVKHTVKNFGPNFRKIAISRFFRFFLFREEKKSIFPIPPINLHTIISYYNKNYIKHM